MSSRLEMQGSTQIWQGYGYGKFNVWLCFGGHTRMKYGDDKWRCFMREGVSRVREVNNCGVLLAPIHTTDLILL